MTKQRKIHTLVIGSGASGLAAAVRLHTLGITDIAVFTEGLHMGTSINTGSDKQTYYKLGMSGIEGDSPMLMAQDLIKGGAVHGDLALAEAALSVQTFFNLVTLGVPFPHDANGVFPGYKTDHDPRRRAASCGPYTSKEMCLTLIDELKRRNIEVEEDKIAVRLLKNSKNHCCGAIFMSHDDNSLETVIAENVVFAVGGPGGIFKNSVYPAVHTGAIGLAAEIGAKMRNLPEFQFGLASTKFRWNVSGSYMQVLPKFISTAADGTSDAKEFLLEYFSDYGEMYNHIFLKGYQWPFAAGHVPGSSLIDIFVHIETAERGRRVFLDYRTDPADFDISSIGTEAENYLTRSGCLNGKSPFERLMKLNKPAIELYRDHGIDIENEMLEVAVCAQHNNGGMAGNLWWESENIKGLFPIGEVNGSHGVTRPGGSALNAGQCGAFRAAEFISKRCKNWSIDVAEAENIAKEYEELIQDRFKQGAKRDYQFERQLFQERMSVSAAFVRDEKIIAKALIAAQIQLENMKKDGLNSIGAVELLRNEQLLTAQIMYLEAILFYIRSGVGSRGSAIVLDENGVNVHDKLDWRMIPENNDFRSKVLVSEMKCGKIENSWENCRPIIEGDDWFENVWHAYREGIIYE